MHPLNLGASLYIPAIHADLIPIARGEKIQDLRSVFFCTEDSIREEDVDYALENIAKTLCTLASLPSLSFTEEQASRNDILRQKIQPNKPLLFIRPRNTKILEKILQIPHIELAKGFILPKFTRQNMQDWFAIAQQHPNFFYMPTLETAEVFDPTQMYALRDALIAHPLRSQILLLRVGGLDLFNLLNIRRHCGFTVYDTALCYCLQQLISIFKPHGFNLSAPAFEGMEHEDILRREVELDVLNGFTVKSAIHPSQLPIIHSVYRIREIDYQVAQALLDPTRPAVFRMDNRMCEKTTHSNWAQQVLLQSKLFGIQ